MTDEQAPEGAPARSRDAQRRLHSDVARETDIAQLRVELMGALTEVSDRVTQRVDRVRDDFSDYIVQHAADHTANARDWEQRWSAITADIAYRKGLIGFPRLVLEWLRQYLPTVLTVGGLVVAAIGFLTGAVSVEVRP